MADINRYADELLLDFADATHTEFNRILTAEFGSDWLKKGVRRHFPEEQFARIERMLRNPMRVVEMDKSPEEIHGLEHFWGIVDGNWPLFGPLFGDKTRTQVYLAEITELRNNLAHRRTHHTLLRSNLIRIVGSCRMVLSALGSSKAAKFADIEDSLSAGGTPWGSTLEGHLPPSDEIYDEFVGRPEELQGLSEWLASDSKQVLVWGYGGAGKSAIAHKFALEVRDSSNENFIAVCWISAKRSEYIEGNVRERGADFRDLSEVLRAIWSSLYDTEDIPTDFDSTVVLNHLNEMPILLVVDDFDTVLEDEDLSAFLLYELRNTRSRVIYTSRHRVPGVRNLEVPPFSDTDLQEFVRVRSVEYGANQQQCMDRIDGIRRVTDGYPLFVNDIIRHAAIIGIASAMEDWSQRRGDAAREYALRRQISHLGQSCGDVLMALSVANRALLPVEISNIAGLTDPDTEAGLRVLHDWRMVNQVAEDDSTSPLYRMNANTRRLVEQTFRGDNRFTAFKTAFDTLTGERVPEAKRRAIGSLIARTKRLQFTEGVDSAVQNLRDSMTGELADSADLYGVLGWLYSKQPADHDVALARMAFEKSHRLGASKIDPYYYWFTMEKALAEEMVPRAQEGEISSTDVADQWKQCRAIAEMGLNRCGPSQLLYYWAGYAVSREAKSRERTQAFAVAEGSYLLAVEWFKKALEAPVSDVATINRSQIYRGLTLALDGLGDEEQLAKTLGQWRSFSETDPFFQLECSRMLEKYPRLRNEPRLRRVATVGIS